MAKAKRHSALLIRWQDGCEQTRWQATVENVYTGEKSHFIHKSELLRFLWHSFCDEQEPGTSAADGGTHANE